MTDLKQELVKTIVDILTDLVPGGKYAQRSLSSGVDWMFSKFRRDPIQHVAIQIYEGLYQSIDLDRENPGAAKSAAYNILETIKKSNLTVNDLVDCCLDAELFYSHVSRFQASGIEAASALRQSLYHNGLRAFCRELMNCAAEIPGLELAVYRRILLNQKLLCQHSS